MNWDASINGITWSLFEGFFNSVRLWARKYDIKLCILYDLSLLKIHKRKTRKNILKCHQ